MPAITIVSGCPGAGKTTLAHELAVLARDGLHLVSDTFYRFPARPVDPATPGAHRQNASVMRALGRAAGAFAEDGYAVFVDGVIGPWLLPFIAREIPRGVRLECVVLQVGLEQALNHVRLREGSGMSAGVIRMQRAFSELGQFARFALETSASSPAEVVTAFQARQSSGEFCISREQFV
jgi:chloramphenicol 3-O-phosphotransferase